MTTVETAYQDLKQMPPHLQNEIIDFIEFVKERRVAKQTVIDKKPIFGCAKGKIKMSDDFDAPLDMFADYMPD